MALGAVRVTRGEDNLVLYQNSKIAKHYFCRTCGIYTHHVRRSNPNQYGINVGCMEGGDPFALGEVPVGVLKTHNDTEQSAGESFRAGGGAGDECGEGRLVWMLSGAILLAPPTNDASRYT